MSNYCPLCFDGTTLRRELERLRARVNSPEKCDFHPSRKAIPGEVIVELFDRVIRDNFWIAEFNPYVETGSSLEDIIYGLASPDDHAVVTNLISDLIDSDDCDPRDGEEPFYAEDQNYVRAATDHNPHAETWRRFKDEVLHHRRFMSDNAKEYLQSIFSGLHWQRDSKGRGVVYRLPVDDSDEPIYRLRQINSPSERKEALKNPALHLGSPPPGLRRANRMNAAGIPAFYAAFDIETCVAENRPPIGSYVVGAAFRLKRPVVVLDVTRFVRPAKDRSLFSPVYRERLNQWHFMQEFMFEISKPVLPNDEALDYVPTQIVSEFLHAEFPVKIDGKRCQIEGIVYRSAQTPNGRNIVLFGDAAMVEQGAPLKPKESPEENLDDWWDDFDDMLRKAQPEPALAVCDGTTFELEVTGVSYTSTKVVKDWQIDDIDL